MCIAMAGALIGLAGAGFSAVQQMQQASTEQKIADRNAQLETQQGAYEAKQLDRKRRYTQGKAAVAAGRSGIGFEGSFLDVIADNEVQSAIDIENTTRMAENRANIGRAAGRAKASRTRAGAVSTIIGGGTTFLKAVA